MREQEVCSRSVAVFDQTSFSVYAVRGADAEAGLQWVCTNDVAVGAGETVYTGMLNTRGGYEADVTVTRTGDDAFLVVSSAATTVRDLDWLRRHLPAGVVVEDLSDDLAVLGHHQERLIRLHLHPGRPPAVRRSPDRRAGSGSPCACAAGS